MDNITLWHMQAASRSLSALEKHYSIMELEILAEVCGPFNTFVRTRMRMK